MKCLCFCYLGLELALTRGPVALLGTVPATCTLTIRTMAHILTWATTRILRVRGLPVLIEGWKYLARTNGKRRREDGWQGERHESRGFFDVDGTLTELPSLERRYFRALRAKERFLCETELRGSPNLCAAAERPHPCVAGNKAYLRGFARAGSTRIARGAMAPFFPEAVECAEGTPRMATNRAGNRNAGISRGGNANRLSRRAGKQKSGRGIHVCARGSKKKWRWTGRVLGGRCSAKRKG